MNNTITAQRTFVTTAEIIMDLTLKAKPIDPVTGVTYYCVTLAHGIDWAHEPFDYQEYDLGEEVVDHIVAGCQELIARWRELKLPRAVAILCKDELAQATFFM